MARPRTSPIKRFWPRTKPDGGCLVWTGAPHSKRAQGKNHGIFCPGGKQKTTRSHRWLYEQALGVVPDARVVMHTCDSPRCVKLQHLDLGTLQLNNLDMRVKGRNATAQPRGERHGSAKLSDAEVLEIRRQLEGSRRRGIRGELAHRYGVSKCTIDRIGRGVRFLASDMRGRK